MGRGCKNPLGKYGVKGVDGWHAQVVCHLFPGRTSKVSALALGFSKHIWQSQAQTVFNPSWIYHILSYYIFDRWIISVFVLHITYFDCPGCPSDQPPSCYSSAVLLVKSPYLCRFRVNIPNPPIFSEFFTPFRAVQRHSAVRLPAAATAAGPPWAPWAPWAAPGLTAAPLIAAGVACGWDSQKPGVWCCKPKGKAGCIPNIIGKLAGINNEKKCGWVWGN